MPKRRNTGAVLRATMDEDFASTLFSYFILAGIDFAALVAKRAPYMAAYESGSVVVWLGFYADMHVHDFSKKRMRKYPGLVVTE